MKKISKKIIAFLGMVATIFASSPVFAKVGYDPSSWSGSSTKVSTGEVTSWVDTIINVVSIVGSGIAIIALIVLGVKYMMGSVEEKAEYKKTLLPYFVGAVFVFAASALVGVIYNFTK